MECVTIADFKNRLFVSAFKQYFSEFGINVNDWESLFDEMNREEHMGAFLMVESGDSVLGFIQYQFIQLNSSFFEQNLGFIREFWVQSEYRKRGYGTYLLKKAEEHFCEKGIKKIILTSDTEEVYFTAHGYKRDMSIYAKNNDNVYVKEL